MKTVVCVPSRGRPGNITRLVDAVRLTALGDVVVWVYVDDTDPYRDEYVGGIGSGVIVDVNTPRRLVPAWNYQASQIRDVDADQVCFWGDDVVPETPGWDQLLGVASEGGTCIVYGRDGYWDDHVDGFGHLMLPTAVAMSPGVIQAIGGAVPVPGLQHLFADNSWKALGLAAGRLRFVPQVMIRHYHPTHPDPVYRARMDATYETAASNQHQFDVDGAAHNAWLDSDEFTVAAERLRAL